MIFDWYSLFDLAEFMDTGLVSRALSFNLEGIGLRDILIVRGNRVSMIYDDVLIHISEEEDLDPVTSVAFDGYASFLDADGMVWLGIPTE